MRTLGATAVAQLQGKKASDVEVISSSKIDAELLGVFHNSFFLSNYEWSKKDTTPKPEEDKKDGEEEDEVDERTKRLSKKIDSFTVSHEQHKFKSLESFKFQDAIAKATEFARNLSNERGSVADPAWMEQKVSDLLFEANAPEINDIRILRGQDLVDQGMHLFHSVGKGATSEPRCIVVHYKGNPDSEENEVALIGKGVTFDTGGLNLKPTGYMEDMYGDKNGSAAVLGALHGTLALKPKKNIVFAIALAENAIDSTSYKPGDIIKSMKGLTVEIGNTDAEGRLVLADTFTYVQREFKP